MDREKFEEFILRYPHISEERRKELMQDSRWLTADERKSLVDQLQVDSEKLKKNEGIELTEDQKADLMKALELFKKEELPKIIKEKELATQQHDVSEAEGLLDNMDQ